MTPHLHPRSRLTTSLFGTTLMVSFLVVAMPHIVPCPVPRIKFADEELELSDDGRQRRRKKLHAPDIIGEPDGSLENGQLSSLEKQRAAMRRKAHECPVPKPGGPIGRLLGVKPGPAEVHKPDMVIEGRRGPKQSNTK